MNGIIPYYSTLQKRVFEKKKKLSFTFPSSCLFVGLAIAITPMPKFPAIDPTQVKTVHLVHSNHFDAGFAGPDFLSSFFPIHGQAVTSKAMWICHCIP